MKRIFTLLIGLMSIVSLGVVSAQATSVSNPTCFGYNGVQYHSNVAWECIFTPKNDGGALYWGANVNVIGWDHHPADGDLWVTAYSFIPSNTSRNPQSNPPNSYQNFKAVIADGCVVDDAGYNEEPTTCNGGKPMTAIETRSYEGFEVAMEQATRIPDWAWRDEPGA